MAEEDGEASSARKLWIGGLALAAAIAGAWLVVSGGAAPGEIAEPGDAYSDADERFHVESDSTVTRTHTFQVPRGTSTMTIARALSFPTEGTWRLIDPDGDERGEVTPKPIDSSGALVLHTPETGAWRMEVDCQRSCAYTLAVYYNDALSPPEESLADDAEGADTVVHVRHDQGVSASESFEVPEGTQGLEATWSFYASDGGSFQLEDPDGDRVTRWRWGAEWVARQATVTPALDPQPGTWTIEYECDTGCEGAWGFSFPGATGSPG